jgi:hypothetical protein
MLNSIFTGMLETAAAIVLTFGALSGLAHLTMRAFRSLVEPAQFPLDKDEYLNREYAKPVTRKPAA